MSEKISRRKEEIKEAKEKSDTVSFDPNADGNGGTVNNSFLITSWSDIYEYSSNLKKEYPENFKGSVEGMAWEWKVHNIACYVPFLELEKAQHVDFGKTIFDDPHPGMNYLMWATYHLLFPDQFQADLMVVVYAE